MILLLAVSILNTLDENTSGTVNASTVTTLTGVAADVITSYNSGTITGLGNEKLTLSGNTLVADANTLAAKTSDIITATITEGDISTLKTLDETGNAYTIIVTDTTVAVTDLNTIDNATTVTINVTNVTNLTGYAADCNTAYSSSQITGLGNENVTLSDTSLAVSVLNTLDGNTTGTVNATTITTLTGAAAECNTAYASSEISNLGNENVNLSDTSLAVSVLNTLDENTTGTVNASTITTLTGAAADCNTAYDSDGISGLGNEAITLSDTSLDVSILNTLDGNTTGTVNATTIATLNGAAADCNTAYASSEISGLGDEAVTLDDTSLAVSVLNTLDGNTTGTVNATTITTLTGAAADCNTAYASSEISNLGNENVTLSDTSLAVSILNTLDGNTTGTVNANTITTLTGAAAECNTAYASSEISNLGNENVTLSDTSLAVSVLNTLDENTTGTVNASTITTLTGAAADCNTAYDSDGISGLGNEAITLSDTSLDVSILNTLDGNTSGTVNASTVTTLTGAAADCNTAYASNGISGLADEAVTLDDASLAVSVLNTLDGNTTGTVNASTVTTLTGAAADCNTAYDSDGISGLGNEAVTLNDTSLAVSVLNTLDGNTTGTVNASTVTTLTGVAADVITSYNSGTITNLGNEKLTLSGNTVVADANTLAAKTSDIITATIAEGDISTLKTLDETGNAYTITVTDTTVSANELNTIDNVTTVIVNVTNVTTLTGNAANCNTAYASNGITGLGNEAVTLSDTSLAASVLNTLDGNTSGTIDASSITTLTGTASSCNTAYASGGISNLGNEAVTLSDTSLAATVLNTLDGYTSGTIDANTVTELFGTASSCNTSYASGSISNLGNEIVTLNDTTLAVSVLNTLDGNTTGTVNASTITTLTGAAADCNTAYDSDGISGLGNEAIILSDTSLAVSILNTLDENTSGTVNASTVTTLTGAATDVITSYNSGTITGLGNEKLTLSGNTLVADANTLAAKTNDIITATITEGDISTLKTLDETGNAYTIIVTDITVAVTDLNTIDNATTVTINVTNVTTLTGSAADCNTAYSSSQITGLGNENVTLSDTSLAVSVLNTLDGNTSGTVNATTITTLTGAAADCNTAYASSEISDLGNENVTLSDTSLAVSVLNTLDGNTTGTVNASTVTTLTGAAADCNTAYDSDGISGLGNEEITLSDTSLAVSILNTLDGNTTGTVNASTVITLTGAATDCNTAYASSEISNLGNENVTLSDTSLAVSVLNTLDGNTTGTVNATTITTLTGAAADCNTAYASSEISNLGNENVTLSDTSLAVSVLNTLDGNTTGTVNASTVTTLTGAAADCNTAYDSDGISGLGNEAVTLNDTSLAVSVLNTLDGNTTGTVNASTVTTLTGVAADVITSYNLGTITNLGNEKLTLSGNTFVADANTLAAKTSDIITATITEGDISTLKTLDETGNAYTITVTDTTVSANELNTIDNVTTVIVNVTNVTTLTGNAANCNTAYTSNGITGLGNKQLP